LERGSHAHEPKGSPQGCLEFGGGEKLKKRNSFGKRESQKEDQDDDEEANQVKKGGDEKADGEQITLQPVKKIRWFD
jgi:hypothetical protein